MLSTIASITTLLAFIIYFIGKFIAIRNTRAILKDEIKIDSSEENYEVVDVFTLEENPLNSLFLTSKEGVHSLVIYRLIRDSELNIIDKTKVVEYPFLNIGHTLRFNLTLPEIFANYELTYQTPDYRKVSLKLHDNAKNGVISEEARPKHTKASILYYLFK